jgi:WD40 repeat protein
MNKFKMEIKSNESEKEIDRLKGDVKKRDNMIKLLTGVIEVIKNDVNIKTQQLDFLINHMKNQNFEDFDYKLCINSVNKLTQECVRSRGDDLCNKFHNQNLLKTNKFDLTKMKYISQEIFKFLPAKDLINTSLTCKALYKICMSKEIWENIYFKEFDTFLLFDEKDNAKVIENAKSAYEDNGLYKDFNLRTKYTELKQLNKNWESGRPVVTTISTTECVTCLLLNPNTNELIYSAVDGSASLFRLYSYRKIPNEELYMQHHKQTKICDKLTNFYGHGGPIWSIDRYDDLLFTGSYDKTIKIWQLKTGNCLTTIRAHSSWVSSLQYDPQFNMLLSSSWDSTIKLWNIDTLQNSVTFNTQVGNYIYCVRSNLKDGEVIAGTEFKTIDIWDVNRGVMSGSLIGHLERINNLKYVDNFILSGSEDKHARLWDKRTSNCEILFSGHTRGITQIEYDPINKRVFTASNDRTIKIWDLRKNKELRTLVGHSNSVYSIAFDQTKLISGSKDNSIRIWNFLNE